MSDAQRLAFDLASGVSASALLIGIASIIVLLTLIWATWITFGAFRNWQDGHATLLDVAWSAIRVSILLMVLGFYLR